MKLRVLPALASALGLLIVALLPASAVSPALAGPSASANCDIGALKCKVASLNGTAGLQIRFSAIIEDEGEEEAEAPEPGAPITPTFVLSSPLDGNSVGAPAVTVNQDTAAAPQNETAIAVDPNNPNRIVASANDYVARTWACDVNGTPCSGLG